MGVRVTFDPTTKIIQVTEAPVGGVVNLDVKVDLYSDGKEDWRASASLFKYRFPIRAVGGDPLPGSKALGSTFFLAPGWTIRPYEADHRLIVNGNLYVEDGSSPYTTTVGTYNVLIEAEVSSLVDATVVQFHEITDLHAAHFNRRTRDTVTGDEVIYDVDGITPLHEFTSIDDGSQIIEIAPKADTAFYVVNGGEYVVHLGEQVINT